MTNKENFWTNSDVGLLIVRIALGGIILFHGVNKIVHGIGDQWAILESHGIPGVFIYFVYVSEVLAPALVVLGILTLSAFLMLLGNVLSDVCVALVDPRVKFR